MSDQLEFGDDYRPSRYPYQPGFKRGGDTSEQAAAEMRARASRLQRASLAALRLQDLTADEVAASLGESILAIRPRLSELVAKGKIEASGRRRPNASGKLAIVWRIKSALGND
jgi:hypothetical protein